MSAPGPDRVGVARPEVAVAAGVGDPVGGEREHAEAEARAREATEQLLGAEHTLRRRQVSARAGVSLLSARRFWHALGLPGVGEEDLFFTDADLEALEHVVRLLREGAFDEATALSMTRALARSADRLASWQSSLVIEAVLGEQDPVEMPVVTDVAATLESDREADEELFSRRLTPQARVEAGQRLLALADDLEPLLVYAWRRHLAVAIGQLMEAPDGEGTRARSIGFADMVDFTALVSRLSERQLTHLVQRFEAIASDIVTAHGGRVIKTLGDEVVFVADRPAPAAAIALDLMEAMAEDQGMPSLRAGLATGRVLARFGDVFGNTVNRASRLSQAARPGTVVVDAASADALASVSGFALERLDSRPLRGLGATDLWALRRTISPTRRAPGADVDGQS